MRRTILAALVLLSCRTNDKVEGGGVDTGGLSGTVDADGDGFGADEDCDDSDASVNGGATERCDGIDNDCDGEIDEGVLREGFADADGDGFGDADAPVEGCELPSGAVSNANDCDDTDGEVFPGAIEVCNGIDDDCDLEVDEDLLIVFYADLDGDGYGDPDTAVEACEAPADHVTDGTDCDDGASSTFPGAVEICNYVDDDCDGDTDEGVTNTYTLDQDGDGYGGSGATVEDCTTPLGYAEDTGDCDDTDVAYYPGAPESDCSDPNDYNCDGSVAYADADGDGWAACEECDDSDGAVNPDALEVCDGVDNDCDGATDDDDGSVDLSTGSTWYSDSDSDGYGDASSTTTACDQPSGFVADDTDCDDSTSAVSPSATEVCNSIDDDCDGDVDDDDASLDTTTASVWYDDSDSDGYGDAALASLACDQPSGAVANDGDCDDGDAAIHPLATEVCDGVDNDCDADIDDDDADVTGQTTWYDDTDGDGYGGSSTVLACTQPSGTTAASTDCDDSDGAVNPGATEVCDSLDNDCDGLVDDDDSSVTGQGTYYLDSDGDGYAGSSTTQACSQPSGTGTSATDCDDSDSAINPGATEVCDSLDNDCDALVDDDDSSVTGQGTYYLDSDGDGYAGSSTTQACSQPSGTGTSATDCDDSDSAINPGATEICDSLDNDCDALVDDADGSVTGQGTYYRDLDSDGYAGSSTIQACSQPSGTGTTATDCNDGNSAVNPAATEVCDSVDNDCDGDVDDADSSVTGQSTWYLDGDSDGYAGASTVLACSQPSGSGTSSTDCDDSDPAINPAATEVCDSADNDCDGSVDEGLNTVTTTVATASPSGSCNGNANRSVTFSACGCSDVTLTGSFRDNSDGSGGQVTGASVGSASMTLTWDDAPSGGDCDLDIRSAISWSASKSGSTLTISVTDQITSYSAGNSIAAGYSITGYSTYRRSSGSGTRTFTYTCN